MAAYVDAPRVRQYTATVGTADLALAARGHGSHAVTDVLVVGDWSDFMVSYADAFMSFRGTLLADDVLEISEVYHSRHQNGTIDTNKVSWGEGLKTIIGTPAAFRAAALRNSARFDQAQSLSPGQLAIFQQNFPVLIAPIGTRMTFNQTTVPVGWVKAIDRHDYGLRVVTGSVGQSGSVDYSALHGRTATDSLTLLQGNMPSFNLAFSLAASNASGLGVVRNAAGAFATTFVAPTSTTEVLRPTNLSIADISTFGVGGNIHSGGSGAGHSHPIDMRVRTIDVVIGERTAPE